MEISRGFAATHDARNSLLARRGVIFMEFLLVVIVLGLLLWLTCVVTDLPGSASQESVRRACHVRGVRRIALIPDTGRLWIDRPRDLSVCLDLESGRVEDAMSTQGLESVTQSRDGQCRLLCAESGTLILERVGCEALVWQQASRRGTTIDALVCRESGVAICITDDGHVCGWDTRGGTACPIAYQIPATSPIQRAGLVAPSRLLIARRNGQLSVHDVMTGQEQSGSVSLGCDCIGAGWDHRGVGIAVVTTAGDMEVYDSRTGRRTGGLPRNSMFPMRIAATIKYSPDDEWIAMTSATSQGATAWHRATGRVHRMTAHHGVVSSLEFSADSRHLFTASYDGSIHEWSLAPFGKRRTISEITVRKSDG